MKSNTIIIAALGLAAGYYYTRYQQAVTHINNQPAGTVPPLPPGPGIIPGLPTGQTRINGTCGCHNHTTNRPAYSRVKYHAG